MQQMCAALSGGGEQIAVAFAELDAAMTEWVAALATLKAAGIDVSKGSRGPQPQKMFAGDTPRARAMEQTPPPPPPAGDAAAERESAEDEALLAELPAELAQQVRVKRRLAGGRRSVKALVAEMAPRDKPTEKPKDKDKNKPREKSKSEGKRPSADRKEPERSTPWWRSDG
jgi:hypothetical protein